MFLVGKPDLGWKAQCLLEFILLVLGADGSSIVEFLSITGVENLNGVSNCLLQYDPAPG